MIDMSQLYKGALVKIVDAWPEGGAGEDDEGRMDCYLGQILTVSDISDGLNYFFVEEDRDDYGDYTWYWYPKMVEYIVEEEIGENVNEEEFVALLIG